MGKRRDKKGFGLSKFVNEVVYDKYDYNKKLKETLKIYGDDIIESIIFRKSLINKSINTIVKSFNNQNYDTYFHLDVFINNKIKIEKNEKINISTDLNINTSEMQIMRVKSIFK